MVPVKRSKFSGNSSMSLLTIAANLRPAAIRSVSDVTSQPHQMAYKTKKALLTQTGTRNSCGAIKTKTKSNSVARGRQTTRGYTGWAKKYKLLHFVHIFTKYSSIFTIFFTSGLRKKFATQGLAHHTYYVTTLPCKI